MYHAQTHRIFRFNTMERTQPHETEANFSIEEYGAKTAEKEECEEQLLTEYATLLGFYLARIVAKDRITGILRAPFVSYIRSAGAGEVEEEPRGRGFQRGIGHLMSCPYCMAPWCATALAMGFVFAPRVTRFFAGILVSVAASDFLHRAYAKMQEEK